MKDQDRPPLGIALRLLSGLLMAGMFVSVKAVSDNVPLGQIVFFRAAFAIIPLVLFLWLRGEFPSGLYTKRPGAMFLRASFGAMALFLAFAAVARLNLAEAVLIAQLSPILLAFGAMIFLSERATPWRWAGLAFGFLGVVVLVWPDLKSGAAGELGRLLGYGFAFLSACLSAAALLMVRSLAQTESPGAIALYFVFASLVGAVLSLPWGWVSLEPSAVLYLVLAGLFGGCGHIAMTLAFRFAEASRLAPFEYVALLWPVLADVFLFQLPLSTAFLLSAPLILLGALIAAGEGRKS